MVDEKKLTTKPSAGWPWRPRTAENMVLEAVTRKEVTGWSEAGRRGVPVLSKRCCKRQIHGGARLLPYPHFFGKEIGKLVKGGRQG